MMRRFRDRNPSRAIFLLFALGTTLFAGSALGDLGALVARGKIGPDQITVLASPSPLRVGEIALSVSLQSAQRKTDAKTEEIGLIFTPPTGDHMGDQHRHHSMIHARARRDTSTHPGMLGALVELHRAGTWGVQAVMDRSGTKEVFSFDLEVSPPASPWVDYGLAFAFPALGLLIFIWHQRRRLAGARQDQSSP